MFLGLFNISLWKSEEELIAVGANICYILLVLIDFTVFGAFINIRKSYLPEMRARIMKEAESKRK